METPNPENIIVATRNFYLDPTHQRPIPAELLSFISEYYGFARVKTVRLQEPKDLIQNTSLTLQNVLEGVSPDYAIIAQKAADENIFETLDATFAVDYGLSLETLSMRYHAQLVSPAQNAAERAQQAEAAAQTAIERADQTENIALNANQRAQQAEAAAQRAEQILHAIYTSRSWRITAPLRLVGKSFRWFVRGSIAWLTFAPMSRPQRFAKAFLIILKNKVSAHPALKMFSLRIMSRFPRLKARLKKISNPCKTDAKAQNVTSTHEHMGIEKTDQLSARAKKLYFDLKKAVGKNGKELY